MTYRNCITAELSVFRYHLPPWQMIDARAFERFDQFSLLLASFYSYVNNRFLVYLCAKEACDCERINPDLKDFYLHLAVSQILDSLEDIQWLTINDRIELDFLQKLFEDKQLQTLLEVKKPQKFPFPRSHLTA